MHKYDCCRQLLLVYLRQYGVWNYARFLKFASYYWNAMDSETVFTLISLGALKFKVKFLFQIMKNFFGGMLFKFFFSACAFSVGMNTSFWRGHTLTRGLMISRFRIRKFTYNLAAHRFHSRKNLAQAWSLMLICSYWHSCVIFMFLKV